MHQNSHKIVDYTDIDYRNYWIGDHMEAFDKQEKKVVDQWLTSRSGWFIDLGCGFGRMVPIYKNKFRTIVMVDYAINNLKMVQQQYPHAPFIYIAADACRLPFQTASFSHGISIRLLQNIFEPQKMMTELSRVLIPKAPFMMSYFNRRNLLRILRYGKRCFKQTHAFEHVASYGHMCGTHPSFFQQLLRQNRLHISAQKGVGLIYQISRPSAKIQRLIAHNRLFKKIICSFCYHFDTILGALNLSLWQFVLLQKNSSEFLPVGRNDPATVDLFSILMCIHCGGEIEETNHDYCRCKICGYTYPFSDGIYDFRV